VSERVGPVAALARREIKGGGRPPGVGRSPRAGGGVGGAARPACT